MCVSIFIYLWYKCLSKVINCCGQEHTEKCNVTAFVKAYLIIENIMCVSHGMRPLLNLRFTHEKDISIIIFAYFIGWSCFCNIYWKKMFD